MKNISISEEDKCELCAGLVNIHGRSIKIRMPSPQKERNFDWICESCGKELMGIELSREYRKLLDVEHYYGLVIEISEILQTLSSKIDQLEPDVLDNWVELCNIMLVDEIEVDEILSNDRKNIIEIAMRLMKNG